MNKRILILGIVSSLFVVLFQIFLGTSHLLTMESFFIPTAFGFLNQIGQIAVFIVLRQVIVGLNKIENLNVVILLIISALIVNTSLSAAIYITEFTTLVYVLLGFSILTMILQFIFMFRVSNIDKNRIKHILYLNGFAMTLILWLLLSFTLKVISEIKGMNLEYIDEFIKAIPYIFLLIFINKTKNEINAST